MTFRIRTSARSQATRHRAYFLRLLLGLLLATAAAGPAQAVVPGLLYPTDGELSDVKLGSILFYNYYTSNALNPAAHNTRIDITNNSDKQAAFVRLFFVIGSTGSPASIFLGLVANQTVSLLTSEIDPGITGYVVAVAVDGVNGCPISNNVLSGRAAIKFPSGSQFQGGLNAVAVTAQFTGILPGCDANSVTAVLGFNGTISGYNKLPRLLEADSIPSQADARRAFFVLNRIGGSLGTGASSIGDVEGTIFRNDGKPFVFGFNGGPQVQSLLKKGFPTNKFKKAIPAKRTGWFELDAVSDLPVLGAVLFDSPGGAVNLRAQTLTANGQLSVPVDVPSF